MLSFNRRITRPLLLLILSVLVVMPVLAAPVKPTPLGKPVVVSTPVPTSPAPTQAAEATPLPVQPAEADLPVLDEGPYAGIPFSRTVDGAPLLGYPDAPITIIEFADYACPHCQRYEPVMQNFIQEYVATGRARYEFRTFPTAGGETTYIIGSIVACFEDQRPGVFWTAHERLFEMAMNNQYDEAGLQKLATTLEINYEDALTCAASAEKLQVDIDVELGRSLDVAGTPAVRVRYGDEPAVQMVVGGELFDSGGPSLDILAQAVEEAEAGGGAA
jgi:protein-disulfide isomerase